MHASFLTGGAALAGYHLGHRSTDDLDLFTLDKDDFERLRFVLRDVAEELRATLTIKLNAPGFCRYLLANAHDTLVVDTVLEIATQRSPEKPSINGVRVDPPEEILANKLTAVMGRMEERDLVDLLFLARDNHSIEEALPWAERKDGGCTPAALAWLLSETKCGNAQNLPGGVSGSELQSFIDALVVKLRALALPDAKPIE
jgi:hypothetical protein